MLGQPPGVNENGVFNKRADEFTVDVTDVIGERLFESTNILYPGVIDRRTFLKDISSAFAMLSKQENKVYKYLVKGFPAR